MDANFKNLLKKEGKNAIIDADWTSVQQRLQEVMGPLGAAWNQCALVRANKVDRDEVDLGSLADTLQLSASHFADRRKAASILRINNNNNIVIISQ